MTQADMQWWEATRAKGRTMFIWHQGVLRFARGFSVFVLVSFLFGWLVADPRREPWTLGDGFTSVLGLIFAWGVITMAVSVAVGALAGTVLWRHHESDYQRTRHRHSTDSGPDIAGV